MVRNVVVVGGGSAGFLTALSLRTRMPDLPVTVIRSREIGIIGVGEGTTFVVPQALHGFLRINRAEFHRTARPTWKLGIKFLWGPRPFFHYTFLPLFQAKWSVLSKSNGFYCADDFEAGNISSALMSDDKVFRRGPTGDPLIGQDAAYHLENASFVAALEAQAARAGVVVRDDTIVEVARNDSGVSGLLLRSGERISADLYVDCSGFASLLLGKTLGEPFVSFRPSLFCDRAVVGGWERTDEPIHPYTTAETMNSGWCWQIEHEHRINRGYVYCSDFITDEDAEREFRAKNPKVGPTRVVRFVTGMYGRSWVKNVVAVGNASGFVEPLESTSLSVICDESKGVAETLAESDRQPRPSTIAQYNLRSRRTWEIIRQFLAVHYRFNTRLDTPFWRECREKVDLAGAEPIVEYYRENGPSTLWQVTLLDKLDPFLLEGYYTMLMGQGVPFHSTFTPGDAERQTWEAVRGELRAQARQGFGVAQALAKVNSPDWAWTPGF